MILFQFNTTPANNVGAKIFGFLHRKEKENSNGIVPKQLAPDFGLILINFMGRDEGVPSVQYLVKFPFYFWRMNSRCVSNVYEYICKIMIDLMKLILIL